MALSRIVSMWSRMVPVDTIPLFSQASSGVDAQKANAAVFVYCKCSLLKQMRRWRLARRAKCRLLQSFSTVVKRFTINYSLTSYSKAVYPNICRYLGGRYGLLFWPPSLTGCEKCGLATSYTVGHLRFIRYWLYPARSRRFQASQVAHSNFRTPRTFERAHYKPVATFSERV